MMHTSNFLKSVYDLKDDDHVSSLKWRRGGDQPTKLKEIDQTIDFCFYSYADWICHGLLSLPSVSDVLHKSRGARMPYWNYPSDHFAMGGDIELKTDKRHDLMWRESPETEFTKVGIAKIHGLLRASDRGK